MPAVAGQEVHWFAADPEQVAQDISQTTGMMQLEPEMTPGGVHGTQELSSEER
jgi:hypothetical protein